MHLLLGVEPCVTPKDNGLLLKPYSSGEVVTTLKDIGPTKVPGTDGF